MISSMRSNIYFDSFDGMHSIIDEWSDQNIFSSGGVVVPEYIDKDNAMYSFQSDSGPRIHTFIVIIIKNSKCRITAWTAFDKEFRDGMATVLPIVPIELPLLKFSPLWFFALRKQKNS